MNKKEPPHIDGMIYYIPTHSGHYTIACHMNQQTELKPAFGQLLRLCLGAALMQGLRITRLETMPMITRSGEELTLIYNFHTNDSKLFATLQEQLNQQPGIALLQGNLV